LEGHFTAHRGEEISRLSLRYADWSTIAQRKLTKAGTRTFVQLDRIYLNSAPKKIEADGEICRESFRAHKILLEKKGCCYKIALKGPFFL